MRRSENSGVTCAQMRWLFKVFHDTEQQFVDDEPESAANSQELATSGAMQESLLPYPQEQWGNWWKLTRHIGSYGFPPGLHREAPNGPPADLSAAQWGEWMAVRRKENVYSRISGAY